MTEYEQKAGENFLEGYNCAQSVLLAFAEPLGLPEEQALRLSSSFGGGMGRLREVCGALSALLMVDGLTEGYSDPKDRQAKAEHYRRTQELAAQFRDEMGSILCRELLSQPSTSPVPQERTPEYYSSRPCLRAVRCAARLGTQVLERCGHLKDKKAE